MFKPKSGAKGLAAGAGKSAMIRAQGKDTCILIMTFKLYNAHSQKYKA